MEKTLEIRKERLSFFVVSLCIYFVLLPTGMISIGTVGSLLKIIGLLPVIAFIIDRGFKIRRVPVLGGQVLFLVWIMLSFVWSIDQDLTFERLYSQMLFFLLLVPCCSKDFTNREISALKMSLVWASRLSTVLLLTIGSYSGGRLLISGFFTEDPNLLSAYLIYGIANALIIVLKKGTNLRKKILSVVELLFYFYAVISTGSRGGVLQVLSSILIILFFYRENESLSISLKTYFYKFLLIIIILLISNYILSLISDDLLTRYTLQNVVESKGAHRLEYWGWGFNIFNNSTLLRQIFGYGYYTATKVFELYGYPSKFMHNVFIEYVLEIGVVGLLIYTFSIWLYLKQTFKSKDIFSSAIIVGMIVLSLSTNIIAFKPYWNIMMFSTCCFIAAIRK